MRTLDKETVYGNGTKLIIRAEDEKGPGGANHIYRVYKSNGENITPVMGGNIVYQKGGVMEAGVNGITNEILLEIVADRLKSFQEGPFSCQENQQALDKVNAALDALYERTEKRKSRGVEGYSIK